MDTHTEEQAREAVLQHFGIIPKQPEPGSETLLWLARETIRRTEREGRRPGTVKLYKHSIQHLIDVLGENYPVADVKRSHVGDLQDSLLSTGTSPAYINLICRHLRAAFERLVDDETLDRNPFRKFKSLDDAAAEPKHLSKDEVMRFLESVAAEKNEAHRRLIYLYLFTGRRCQEILNIERSDVTPIPGGAYSIRIENIKDRRHRKQTITVGPPVAEHVVWFLNQSKSDHPFRACHPHSISRTVKKHMRAAGLSEAYHLHSLRHTFVTLALKRGENIWKLKDWLGHSTVKVTEGYAHDKPEGGIDIGIVLSAQRGCKTGDS
ncbi:MAG: site-specific integrase [Candidatus Latescibacteria bacterium]|nr:site-specific integrase [Candidatus Latescibacterota bacterium]